MKILHIIFLLNLFVKISSLDSNENFDNSTYDYDYEYDYPNTKKCLAVTPNQEDDCTKIKSDYSVEGKRQEIACCYVTYNSDDEGNRQDDKDNSILPVARRSSINEGTSYCNE